MQLRTSYQGTSLTRREHRGQHADTRLGGRGALRRLEVNGQIVGTSKTGCLGREIEEGKDEDGSALHDAQHNHGIFSLLPLYDDQQAHEQGKPDNEADWHAVGPGTEHAAVFERKEDADERGDNGDDAGEVKEERYLFPDGVSHARMSGRFEKEKQDEDSGAANGQVDPEAPSPRHVLSEEATEERAEHGRTAPDGRGEAEDGRHVLGRRDKGKNSVAAAGDACAAEALDGSAQDEDVAVGREGCNQTADFKDADAGQEDNLEGEVLVGLAPEGLESSQGHEEGRAVPANLADAVKLGRDGWDGCGNDTLRVLVLASYHHGVRSYSLCRAQRETWPAAAQRPKQSNARRRDT